MVRFGPAGNDLLFYAEGYKHTYQAPDFLNMMGLDAYEYSFGRGILLKDEMAMQIGKAMKDAGIAFSIHAPYYINFATPSEEMAEKSYMYVIESLKKLSIAGGNRLVVHPASQGKMERADAVELCKKRLAILKDKIIEAGFEDIYICLETMGKSAQIGTYEEILDFCTIYENYLPTFDFGHINALTQGTLKSYDDYKKIIDRSIEVIGLERTKNAHIHFSKIEYGVKGEIKHLTLEDNIYGPEFEPLAKVIKDYNLNCTIICESKDYMSRDAKILKEIYLNV